MIEYIYFVKCPNCDDEPFDFFNDAKDFAINCLSKKPIITQIEVNRNDFGECTDSSDLGTIWSWEDMMKETEDEPAVSVFTKGDFGDYDADNDPEFAALDNSVDSDTSVLDTVPDNFTRKSIPDGMTAEDLVEEMEENEDTVECAWCEDLFDKSECRKEVDLGWLCGRCEAAIKSRGEPLTFVENNYWDFLDEDLTESAKVNFEYDSFTTVVSGPKRDVDDWDELEVTDSFTYGVDRDEVANVIWENFITEEDAANVPGGLTALEDDAAWSRFLETNFDVLLEKYYDRLLKYFEDAAQEAFAAKCDETGYDTLEADFLEDYEMVESACNKTVLEELESAEDYRKRLITCPECGTNSFDPTAGMCINCGIN